MPRIVATTSCQASSAIAPGDVESDAAAPKSSHKHHKHHKKGNGQAGGVVARMTQTLKSAGAAARRAVVQVLAQQIDVTTVKHHRELADQRKHRHPEIGRAPPAQKDSRSLEEVRKERLEWYNTHRPEISEDMTTSERPRRRRSPSGRPCPRLTRRHASPRLGQSTILTRRAPPSVGRLGKSLDGPRERRRDLHAFHKCAKNGKTGEATFGHHRAKFFKKLNGIEAPSDALDYLGFEANVEFPEAVIKYKVEDYNEYMKHRQRPSRPRLDLQVHELLLPWPLLQGRGAQEDGEGALKHPVDDAAFLYAQQATKSVEMPSRSRTHRFFLAYEKMLREDD